ncbi:nucleotidyltransferase [Clostridia bacterium]|nr:nucleotidyltransferase [Clostridia bacterium]
MVYTLEQIAELIKPVVKKYNLKAVWVFGSYARGEANDDSDIDLLIDDSETDYQAMGMFAFWGIFDDFEGVLNKPVDVIINQTLEQKSNNHNKKFLERLETERISLNVQ